MSKRNRRNANMKKTAARQEMKPAVMKIQETNVNMSAQMDTEEQKGVGMTEETMAVKMEQAAKKADDVATGAEQAAEVKEAAVEVKEAGAEVKEAVAEVKEAEAEVKEAAAEVKEAEAEVKKAAAEVKEAVGEAKKVVPDIYVQYHGQEGSMNQVLERIKESYYSKGSNTEPINSLQVYVKPEDYTAYYVINEIVDGKVSLF